MNLSFQIQQETCVCSDGSHVFGFLLLLIQDGQCMMSVFFPSDVEMHRGEAIDVGFDRASSMGQAFISGDAS